MLLSRATFLGHRGSCLVPGARMAVVLVVSGAKGVVIVVLHLSRGHRHLAVLALDEVVFINVTSVGALLARRLRAAPCVALPHHVGRVGAFGVISAGDAASRAARRGADTA